MVELALKFWNGEGRFDPAEWGGLDRHNWQRLMEALAMARGKRMLIFRPAPTVSQRPRSITDHDHSQHREVRLRLSEMGPGSRRARTERAKVRVIARFH
jgi:hypothetical protein